MRAYNIKRKKAFSLTELLIVIIIIGVLAGITMLSMSSMDDKLKANEIVENLRMAKEAALNYYTKNGTWPNNGKYDDSSTIDSLLSVQMDKKLGNNYLLTAGGNYTNSLIKTTSIFIKYKDLDKLPAGVLNKLAKMAQEEDLWNSTMYGKGTGYDSRYYLGSGKTGSNTIHMPVHIEYK